MLLTKRPGSAVHQKLNSLANKSSKFYSAAQAANQSVDWFLCDAIVAIIFLSFCPEHVRIAFGAVDRCVELYCKISVDLSFLFVFVDGSDSLGSMSIFPNHG